MAVIKVNRSEEPESKIDPNCFMVAVGAIVEHEDTGEILLVKRAEDTFKAGVWEVGYSMHDQGEDPETGLRREFMEKTGLKIVPQQLLTSWHFASGQEMLPQKDVIGITFWAKTAEKKVKLSAVHTEYKWVSPEEALEIIDDSGVKRDIRAFIDAKSRQAEAETAVQKYHRALADYQNLLRRTQEEKAAQAKVAALGLIQHLLQPLEHLSLAAGQLDDAGIKMVESEFRQALSDFGLEEIEALGKKFNVETMEAVERQGKGEKVISVLKPGFTLNGQVIQHAKVVLGENK